MSADKLRAVHEALADVFDKPNLNAIGTETSHAIFDQGTLSEAFSGPRLNAGNTEHSSVRFDHAELTGIFNETTPTLGVGRPQQTNFDQAFAEILSEPSPLSRNAQSSRPDFDQQALSEMLSKPSPSSTSIRPPQPSFDHQALAEMIAEMRADPIDPPTPGPDYDTDPPTALFSENPVYPLATPSPVTPSIKEESTRPPRARSLLARLHHIFAAKDEMLRTDGGTDSSLPLLADPAHKPEPAAIAITIPVEVALPTNSLRVESSTTSVEQMPDSLRISGQSWHGVPAIDAVAVTASNNVASILPQQATLHLDDRSTSISDHTDSAPPKSDSERSIPTDAGRPGNVDPDVITVAAAASAEAENALPLYASLWSAETASPKFDNRNPPAPMIRREKLDQAALDQPAFEDTRKSDNSEVEMELTPNFSVDPHLTLMTLEKEPFLPSPPTQSKYFGDVPETESNVPATNSAGAAVQSLLNEIFSPASPSTQSHPFIFGNEASPKLRSGEPDRLKPAAEAVAAPSPNQFVAAQQTHSLSLADLPPLVSTNTTTPSGANNERISHRSAPSDRSSDVKPSAEFLEVHSNGAVDGLPQHVGPLLDALDVLKAKPAPPLFNEKPSRPLVVSQPADAGKSEETITPPIYAESASPQSPKSLMPKRSALVSINATASARVFEQSRWRPPIPEQPANKLPTTQSAALASPTDTEIAAPQTQKAKSLLDELDLSTAIQLRWTMRDIRGNRTKFSPVRADDLTALMDLGLVELRDGLPRLTTLGVLALD
jgi:hypothetical protein